MEEKLFEIFKLADSLNEKQDKVYAQIIYTADDDKTLKLVIKSKKDFSYLEMCQFKLYQNPLIKWENFIKMFESYIGGVTGE